MKKVILYAIFILVATIWAGDEKCNLTEPSLSQDVTYDASLPSGSCQQIGYVCNLGFNIVDENNMMFFNLGAEASCTNLLKSKQFRTRATPNSTTYTANSNFTLIENEENMGPLSLTLAGSLAMLAVNNNIPVDIIYKKVDSLYFNGIKLQSIKILNMNGTANP